MQSLIGVTLAVASVVLASYPVDDPSKSRLTIVTGSRGTHSASGSPYQAAVHKMNDWFDSVFLEPKGCGSKPIIPEHLAAPCPSDYPPHYEFLTNEACEIVREHYNEVRKKIKDRAIGANEIEWQLIKAKIEASRHEEKLAINAALGPIGVLNQLLERFWSICPEATEFLPNGAFHVKAPMKMTHAMERPRNKRIVEQLEAFYVQHPHLRQLEKFGWRVSPIAKADSQQFAILQKRLWHLEAVRRDLKYANELIVNLRGSLDCLAAMWALSIKGTFIPVSNRCIKKDLAAVRKELYALTVGRDFDDGVTVIEAYEIRAKELMAISDLMEEHEVKALFEALVTFPSHRS